MKKTFTLLATATICAASASAAPITSIPEGTLYDEVYRSATTWLVQDSKLGSFQNCGFNGSIVVNGDKIYVYKFVSEVADEYWIEGTITDGVAEFTFPQDISATSTINALDAVKNNSGTVTLKPAADNVLRMTWDGKKLTQIIPTVTDPDLARYAGMVGALNASGNFTGFGEKDSELTVWDTPELTLPMGVTTSNYSLKAKDGWGNDINVISKIGFDGEDVYVQGLNRLMPGTWVKGTLTDGNIVFESGEFAGLNQGGYYNFLYGATGNDVDGFTFEPTLTLKKTDTGYEATSIILINNGNQRVWDAAYLLNATFEPEKASEQIPVKPEMDPFEWDENDEMGAFGILFTLLDTEGQPLEPENTFYNVTIDGVPLSVTATDGRVITDIPYNYGDGEGTVFFDQMVAMMNAGDGYKIFVTFEDVSSISARTVYHTGDKTTYSDSTDWAGIEDVTLSDDIIATEYYNLQGVRIANPEAGIYLRRDIRSNGKSTVSKTVIR